jgi:hypothetical protein
MQRAPGSDDEQPAVRTQRSGADQHFIRAGGGGQPGRDIGRHAGKLEPALRDVALAHEHQACMDAAVERERPHGARRRLEIEGAHGGVQFQGGLGRAPCVVFHRHGMAEDGQHPVTLDAHDQAAMPGDDGRVQVLQLFDQRRVMLRFQRCRQARRTRQVGEEHRHETALRALAGDGGGAARSRSTVARLTLECVHGNADG